MMGWNEREDSNVACKQDVGLLMLVNGLTFLWRLESQCCARYL